jgi:hypothetical protein
VLPDGEPRCATRQEGCLDPLNVATCDGPEDCQGDEECWKMSHDRMCRAEGIRAFCHTDRDCQEVNEWLPDGVCRGGICDFGLTP